MEKVKIDFNKPFLGLDNNAALDVNGEISLGKILAPIIAQGTDGDALKIWAWARAIYAGEVLELDKSDAITLRELIRNNKQITVALKAQLMDAAETK